MTSVCVQCNLQEQIVHDVAVVGARGVGQEHGAEHDHGRAARVVPAVREHALELEPTQRVSPQCVNCQLS